LARQHHMARIEIERGGGVIAKAGEPQAGNGAVWNGHKMDFRRACRALPALRTPHPTRLRRPTFVIQISPLEKFALRDIPQSLKGRREEECKRLPQKLPSPLE